ncbi:hypothetical protein H1R20_g10724, partial [Candolleomyces eurysporus]
MVFFTSVFAAVLAALCAFAVPAGTTDLSNSTRTRTPISEGMHDGFFYSWWTDGGASATYTNGPKGQFSVTWDNGGSLLGGKGWKPGSRTRVLAYTGTFNSTGDSYLAVHGWTQNPLVEYYIVEHFGGPSNPFIGAINKGSITVDGSMYDMGVRTRVNQISIDGPGSTFQQFWSVRRSKRSSGTVDLRAHFRAWEGAGMRLGAGHYYQVLVCEGWFSSGSCNMTVSDVN